MRAFRVADGSHVNTATILGELSVVEMALAALAIPHGKGRTQAAIDTLTQAMPG